MTGSVHTTDPQQVELPFEFVDPVVDREASIEEKFEAFHAANPWVYTELLRMTRELVGRGHRRVGMKMLFDADQGTAVFVGFFATEQDMRDADAVFEQIAELVQRHPFAAALEAGVEGQQPALADRRLQQEVT